MGSVRYNIIDSLLTGITNIKTVNGFSSNFNNVVYGQRDISTIKNFPTTTIEFGRSIPSEFSEDYSMNSFTTDILIVTYVKSIDTIEIESYIEDLKIYFNTHVDFDTSLLCRILNIKYVNDYWIDEVKPIYNRTAGTAIVGLLLKVKYYEVVE